MIREILITPVLNGFLLRVGCQKVVFTDRKVMAESIEAYYRNPEEYEKVFVQNAINSGLIKQAIGPAAPTPCDADPMYNRICEAPAPAQEARIAPLGEALAQDVRRR